MSTLFVAWQAPAPTRAWFPIGRLDASSDPKEYVFRYTRGALRARDRAGFEPLIAFPEFERRYEASELFPLFKNRVLEPNRTGPSAAVSSCTACDTFRKQRETARNS